MLSKGAFGKYFWKVFLEDACGRCFLNVLMEGAVVGKLFLEGAFGNYFWKLLLGGAFGKSFWHCFCKLLVEGAFGKCCRGLFFAKWLKKVPLGGAIGRCLFGRCFLDAFGRFSGERLLGNVFRM